MERRWFSSALLSVGALGPCVGYAQPPEQAPDTMEARVMACAPCHGAKGEGTNNAYFPRLAGKPAGYLTNQLLAFHTGRRHYPPMNYLLAYQSEDYLKKIADYFAAQRPPLPPPAIPDVSNEVLARGESIVAHGDAGGQRTRLFELPRSASYGHGARNSRPSRLARELYQRATRRMALWHTDCNRARLHADRRRSSHGGRRQGDCRLPRFAAGAARSFACAPRQFRFAVCLRE